MGKTKKSAKNHNILFLFLVAAELIHIFVSIIPVLKNNSGTFLYTPDMFTVSEGENGQKMAESPVFTLDKGIYTVSLKVDADRDQEMIMSVVCDTPGMEKSVVYDDIKLKYAADEISERIYIYDDNVDVHVRFETINNCRILNNEIFTVDFLKKRSLFYWLFRYIPLFGFADTAIWLLFFSENPKVDSKRRAEIVYLAVFTILASIPFISDKVEFGHDMHFHLTRIAGLAGGLKYSFPVKMQAIFANGYGYPVGVYYGDVLLIPSALMFLIGFPLGSCYKFYIFMVNFLTAFVSLIAFKKVAKNETTAITASFLYSFGIFHFVDLFTRAAFGEAGAACFLPLLAVGFYMLLKKDNEEYIKNGTPCIFLIAGFTGLIQTHVLTTLIATFFAVIACLIYAKRFFKKAVLKPVFKAFIITLFLNIWFIVPFVDYYFTVPTAITSETPAIQNEGSSPQQLFRLEDAHNWGYDTSYTEPEITQTIGIALLAVIGFGLIIWIITFITDRVKKTNKCCISIGLVLIAILGLFMSTYYFPYDFIMTGISPLYRIIGAVQFPWRYLSLVPALSALIFIQVSDFAANRKKWIAYILCGVLCAASLAQGLVFTKMYMDPPKYVYPIYAADSAFLSTYDGFLEYVPADCDMHYLRKTPGVGYSDENVSIQILDRSDLKFTLNAANTSNTEGWIELPLVAYKGYRVLGDSEGLSISPGANWRMHISVAPGYKGTFTVTFKEFWYWRAAECISLITIIVLLSSYRKKKKNGST